MIVFAELSSNNIRKEGCMLSRSLKEEECLAAPENDAIIHLKDGKEFVLGESTVFQEFIRGLKKVAKMNATVLLSGKSGTGKELAARLIHDESDRSEKPFVVIDCAALSESLHEEAIFGREKGAYTSATNARSGAFKHANGGTVFLDEIAEASLEMQKRLLRIIQERSYTPLGSNRVQKVDVRLICATNKNLATEVQAGRFREDLYFRLSVLSFNLPLLAERVSDIKFLAEYFLAEHLQDNGLREKRFSKEALRLLRGYSWPGNIRELSNVVLRAILKNSLNGDSQEIATDDVIFDKIDFTRVEPSADALHPGTPLEAAIRFIEEFKIREAMDHEKGNQKRAAERLGITPRSLRYRIERLQEN